MKQDIKHIGEELIMRVERGGTMAMQLCEKLNSLKGMYENHVHCKICNKPIAKETKNQTCNNCKIKHYNSMCQRQEMSELQKEINEVCEAKKDH